MDSDTLKRLAELADRVEGNILDLNEEDKAALQSLRDKAIKEGVVDIKTAAEERGWDGEVLASLEDDEERVVRFSGGSDDLVSISGAPGSDEPGFTSSRDGEWTAPLKSAGKVDWAGCWQVVTPDGQQGLKVHALYDITWSFAVSMLGEDTPLPDWEISVDQGDNPTYSTLLTIRAPGNVLVEPLF